MFYRSPCRLVQSNRVWQRTEVWLLALLSVKCYVSSSMVLSCWECLHFFLLKQSGSFGVKNRSRFNLSTKLWSPLIYLVMLSNPYLIRSRKRCSCHQVHKAKGDEVMGMVLPMTIAPLSIREMMLLFRNSHQCESEEIKRVKRGEKWVLSWWGKRAASVLQKFYTAHRKHSSTRLAHHAEFLCASYRTPRMKVWRLFVFRTALPVPPELRGWTYSLLMYDQMNRLL